MAITARELEALRASCGVGVDLAPDVAEYLEGRADELWSQADVFAARAANASPAVNDGTPLRLARPRWTLDSLAAALDLRLVEERLPGLLVGAYVRAQGLILVDEGLTAAERSPVVTHETGHAALHPQSAHVEVSYLALSLLYPRRLLRELPEGRAISAYRLSVAVPYRTPWWCAEYRAGVLARGEQSWR